MRAVGVLLWPPNPPVYAVSAVIMAVGGIPVVEAELVMGE
jgi:hypothetical protein